MSLVIRRHHIERLKKARKYHFGRCLTSSHDLGKVVTTPTPCSCWMCGNPRKYFGDLTKQEIIHSIDNELELWDQDPE